MTATPIPTAGPDSADLTVLHCDLAAAFRLAVRYGLHEGICNHFSYAVSDSLFLINPHGLHWSEITASCLCLVDLDGRVIEGDLEVEPTAFYIHGRIHRACPHARCVMHTHMPYATALTVVEGGRVEPCEQNALRFYDRIAYDDDYHGLALDAAEGDRIAAKLGNRSALFLANHGIIVVGPDVARAFDDLYYLERACRIQVLARSTGLPLKNVSEPIARRTAELMEGESRNAGLHFAAQMRLLDRDGSDYAD